MQRLPDTLRSDSARVVGSGVTSEIQSVRIGKAIPGEIEATLLEIPGVIC